MKKWEHDAIAEAATGTMVGQLYEWNELAEALAAQRIPLHPGVRMSSVREICRLILAERKTTEANAYFDETEDLQRQLLERGIYANRHDIAQCYRDYCESFAASSWCRLTEWDCMDCIRPVDYIAARVTK